MSDSSHSALGEFLDLVDSVEVICEDNWEASYKESLFSELKITVLAFISTIFLGDGDLSQEEYAFLNYWQRNESSYDQILDLVTACFADWQKIQSRIPEFLKVAVCFDLENETNVSANILIKLQRIALLAIIADGEPSASEQKTIVRYLTMLSHYIQSQGLTVQLTASS